MGRNRRMTVDKYRRRILYSKVCWFLIMIEGYSAGRVCFQEMTINRNLAKFLYSAGQAACC